MVLGYGDSISYDQLVQRITGDTLDKSHRFTDWSRRPLSPAQVKYAISDVTHLRDVFAALDADLAKRGRSEWVGEEMEVLTSPDTYRADPETAWQRLKTRVRKPKELAVLMEVAAWREREAQTRDVPRGRVLKDDVIGEIATQAPTTVERLAGLRSLPRGFERSKWGQDILQAVARGVEDLEHPLVRHQLVERLEVEALGERVDDDRLVGARYLGDAQQRIVGGLAQELGVDGDEGMARHLRTGAREFRGGGDRLHRCREPNPIRLAHGNCIIVFVCRAGVACG